MDDPIVSLDSATDSEVTIRSISGQFDHFSVSFHPPDVPNIDNVSVSQLPFEVTGLTPGKLYNVTVVVVLGYTTNCETTGAQFKSTFETFCTGEAYSFFALLQFEIY